MTDTSFKIEYAKMVKQALAPLSLRQKEIVERRFGLKTGTRETLESVGKSYGITRERVRQIVNNSISKAKPKIAEFQKELALFERTLKATGGVRKESSLLFTLGGEKFTAHAFFLLSASGKFLRVAEDDTTHAFWAINNESAQLAKDLIEGMKKELKKANKPVALDSISLSGSLKKAWLQASQKGYLLSILEISQEIGESPEGLWGFLAWPEVNPRTMRDKSYIVFRKEKRPLHFREVATYVGNSALPQTIHNELIKDSRFVLVGRGMYALKEWGYQGGDVKDVISYVLANSKGPLSRDQIMSQVLGQRFVKESTILFNLNNKKHFSRTQDGKYTIRGEA